MFGSCGSWLRVLSMGPHASVCAALVLIPHERWSLSPAQHFCYWASGSSGRAFWLCLISTSPTALLCVPFACRSQSAVTRCVSYASAKHPGEGC